MSIIVCNTFFCMKIPKIIHQVWSGVDEPLPVHFKKLGQTWKDTYPDWEYKLWDNDMMNMFIDAYCPEYRAVYDGFPYNVQRWDAIRVVNSEWNFPATGGEAGGQYTLKYVIDEQGLNDAIGLEKVNIFVDKNGEEKVFSVEPLTMTGHEGNHYTFEATLTPRQFGQYKSAVRMYPKHPNLPHRQDFCYLKWLELPAYNN